MRLPRVIFFWFVSFTAVSFTKGGVPSKSSNNKKPVGSSSKTSLTCQITVECVISAEVVVKLHRYFQCNPVQNQIISDYSYPISLPSAFAQAHLSKITAGLFFVNIPGGRIVNKGGSVYIPKNSVMTIVPPPDLSASVRRRQRRQLLNEGGVGMAVGTKSVLVLRISALDASNYFTSKEIFNLIFNDTLPLEQPSLKSQFAKASFGKLNFIPTKLGVLEVSVSVNATGNIAPVLRDAAIATVQRRYGVESMTDLADFIMFCMPPGTGGWASSATVGGWRTVYNDVWCGFISAQMHELGHNLGLLHSNIGPAQYMDFTSYMSAGFGTTWYPSKAFNGANNYQLGWYKDRMVSMDPSRQGPQLITLASFVDYEKRNKDNPVLIKVGNDTFLQYNRAKDFNYQAQACIDQVTVVQLLSNGTNMWGCVDPNTAPVNITNFGESGKTLFIAACDNGVGTSDDPDWIQLSIGFDQNYCGQSLTSRPITPKPTPLPTTSKPSPQPTLRPTRKPPTLPITFPPTARPTAEPTSLPILPSQSPLLPPTESPGPKIPATVPTFAPVRNPSPPPAKTPTSEPQQISSPTTLAPTRPACYDSSSVQFIVSGVNRTCTWLRGQPTQQTTLCKLPTTQVACRRTCKLCQDGCVDLSGTFPTSNMNRTCQWLSTRPTRAAAYFCGRAEVSRLCLVTCQRCPS